MAYSFRTRRLRRRGVARARPLCRQRDFPGRRRLEDEEADLVLGDRIERRSGRASLPASAPRLPSAPAARARRSPASPRARKVSARQLGMQPTLRPNRRSRNVRTAELCARRCESLRRPAGELRARAHAELGVDMGQVGRDRPLAEEERGGDLAVRSPLGDEFGDAALGWRQALCPAAAADPSELGAPSPPTPVSPAPGRSGVPAAATRVPPAPPRAALPLPRRAASGALERHRHALVLGEGASERLERGLEVAVAAARSPRERAATASGQGSASVCA